MPEESKAKKLAAARKKLKEYQQRGSASSAVSNTTTISSAVNESVSSNISERSLSESQLNGSNADLTPPSIVESEAGDLAPNTDVVSYFSSHESLPAAQPESLANNHSIPPSPLSVKEETIQSGMHTMNAIQILINEKAQLGSELNRYRTASKEKDLELEELRVQYSNANKRLEELQNLLKEQQKHAEQQRFQNAELHHKLAQERGISEDQITHLNELKTQLDIKEKSLEDLSAEYREKCNGLELAQLRIRQLSDENNITRDNRVETLTQTQFMYEQQIRDLQAMVQQLTQDKEQANMQYQTYVQQLNSQVQQLNERNGELMDETAKQADRERQLVEHVQQLEKEIQKNLSRQDEFKRKNDKESENQQHLKELEEKLNDYEFERHEFQLKIKSQEDRLDALQRELQKKQEELDSLREHLDQIESEQPDQKKLLATMESDKVAASRALTQNVNLKKQLDELELRFVQLTNDKAELMNRLDSEQYNNREMQESCKSMQYRLQNIDERFKFKDEEMIRLSHENEELRRQNEILQKVAKGRIKQSKNTTAENDTDILEKEQEYEYEHHDGHDHKDIELNKETCNYHHANQHHHHDDCHSEHDFCQEIAEECVVDFKESMEERTASPTPSSSHLATEEAVEKLQKRFTKLMSQVADLTDEKQRLEHLVLQLQDETETIGEYIALYQTQRRMLKQREYEKAAQTQLLQAEREQMHERLALLNNLVNRLGVELPEQKSNLQVETLENNDDSDVKSAVESQPYIKNRNSRESQEILAKIHNIITEIEQNTKELPSVKHTVDHLNCCMGKFEVV
uniref:Golgin subfamily A conserved domain-containing protein n=1 Tax=Glossina brevipalpis TaxID=37001 RepID=A0A1A9W7R8_9MUSC